LAKKYDLWFGKPSLTTTRRRSDEGEVDLTMLDSDSSRGGGQRSGTAGQLLSGIGNVYTPTWGCDVTTAKPPVNTEEGVFSEDDDEFQIRTYPPSLLAAPCSSLT
jgi:hypothetical protein|tara:strand:+ start:5677 stop:5991 length:315 start_codon:yes stop_codon:yes gene_type:complete